VADFIAQILFSGVGGVFSPGDSVPCGILFNFNPGGKEERADKDTLHSGHSRKTFDSRASGQVDEKCLSLVIKVVGHGNLCITMLLAEFIEPTVTQFTGCHLDGNSLQESVAFCIKTFKVERNSVGFSPFFTNASSSSDSLPRSWKLQWAIPEPVRDEAWHEPLPWNQFLRLQPEVF
jgi:hypothetical protein